MKKYINWLWATSNIRKAKFNMFWAILYVTFFGIIIHEAIADTSWALIGLVFPGAMVYHQWREFKSDTKLKEDGK
jgi:hypothetical protein